jgi:hemerythrin-like metal-binding protein
MSWDDAYSVGIKEIDDQHKQLIQFLNDLHDALGNGTAMAMMQGLIADLLDYADYHFTTEEALFEKYKYPERYEHAAEHEDFATKVSEIEVQLKISKNDYLLPIETMKFLRNWLLDHMQQEDQLYAQYFRANPLDN